MEQTPKRKRILKYLCIYTLVFAVTFLFAYSPFLEAGKSFIWKSDGRNQHYPALVYIGRYLRRIVLNILEGNFSIPMFDLSLGLGEDVISVLNYYGFGNPLYLLSVFVPTHYTEYLYNALIVLRLYLAGLSFLTLCKYKKKEFPYALIGTIIYTFSGFAIFSAVRHPYFIEPMVQLPLLVIGVDVAMRKKRSWLFVGVVFYSALCGYYFLYMMTVMLAVYVLVHFFEYYPQNRIRNFFEMAWSIVRQYCWGIGLSAVIFVPTVIGFLTSSRAGETIERDYLSYGAKYYITNFLRSIAPPGSWNSLSLAAVALFAVACLLVQKRKHRSLKWMLGVSLLVFVLPVGGYIMNGFAYPSQRWTFGFALLLSYITVEMLPTLLDMQKKHQVLCLGVFLAYVMLMFYSSTYRTKYHIAGAALLGLTLLVLILLREEQKRLWNVGVIACTLLVMFNVGVNGIYEFSSDYGNYISEFYEYGTETSRIENSIERDAEPYMEEMDGRFDSSHFSVNVGSIWNVPTVNTYWSVINKNAVELWEETENAPGIFALHRLPSSDQRSIFSTLLSTKYYIQKESTTQYVPYGYSFLKKTKSGNLIYENQYALPWGYTYDSAVTYESFEGVNGVELQELMLQTIALEELPDGIKEGAPSYTSETLDYEIAEQNDVVWDRETGKLKVKKADATLVLEFQMPEQVEGYVYLKGFDINNSGQSSFSVKVASHGVTKTASAKSTKDNWYFGRENYLFNLGYSDETRTTCTITFPKKGTFSLEDIELYIQPMDSYAEQVEALRSESLENIEFSSNRMTGTIEVSQDKLLCISIPYSSGWTARIDGKKTEILKGNYMFMVIPLAEGYHEIELTYCTPGIKLGAALSLLSAVGVVVVIRRERAKRKKEREVL